MATDLLGQVTDDEEQLPGQDASSGDEAQGDDEQYFIRVDRRDLHRSLGALVEDPEFSQAARTIFAGKNTRELRQALRAVEEERDNLRHTVNGDRFRAMEADGTLETRLKDDPRLARQYADHREANPQRGNVARQLRAAVDDIIDDLEEAGAPAGWREDIHRFVANGDFGKSAMEVLPNVTKYVERNKVARPWAARESDSPANRDGGAGQDGARGNANLRSSPDVSNGGKGKGSRVNRSSASSLAGALARGEMSDEEFNKAWREL